MSQRDLHRLYDVFKEQAEAISARVYRVKDPRSAGELLTRIVQELNATIIGAARSDLVKACLDAADKSQLTVFTQNLQQQAKDIHLGLSEVDLAIAETGTLMQNSTALDQRLVSTLPPVHVALVHTGRMVEYFVDAIDLLNDKAGDLPGYTAFISGPSRTADIERVLTIGVHGPKELYIIFVDHPGGDLN
ncbi:L-lactate dehydrogenase complex protein LldG [Desulfotomaculum arcticum]|uniref:L-lactate dehydrogenase complex protein LldG n=1 Tax=Desulfotruncus arcticus DSM 17038 TaxID=1121424 RepID=A0A1I2PAA6_9FIRM|nr:lactate utilization protein [Desulfotruncus arcticus]SFG12430.1 L-lactate dehydrogenase complex protein LldG [Desulfotomaculum arcticum] [Desulfotruncus arcticus DSM 17038]